jgi:hypothetical protein
LTEAGDSFGEYLNMMDRNFEIAASHAMMTQFQYAHALAPNDVGLEMFQSLAS